MDLQAQVLMTWSTSKTFIQQHKKKESKSITFQKKKK